MSTAQILVFGIYVALLQNVEAFLLGANFGIPTINRTFDYVVVGGGNAGLTIASRLSEDLSLRVAVVEAGSFYEITTGNTSEIPAYEAAYWNGKDRKDSNPLVDWGFMTTPQAVSAHFPRIFTIND